MNPSLRARGQRGFTLVEISIVLVIVGLLIGGMIAPLSSQLEQKKGNETRQAMELAREALFGYALRNGYLPCPAISAVNGLEDRTGSACNKRYGYLPWTTLGVGRLDGWNRILGYTVTPAFSDSVLLFTLKTARDITVVTRDSQGRITPLTDNHDVPAALISFGRNGYGATSDQHTRLADGGAGNDDEKTNLRSGTTLVSRDASDDPRAPGGAYDDIVLWISPNILYNRMVAAQRLP
ncbi:type II secretion system protein [Duganella violaceipulchra]|uniref:Prepilin-type N-terminal cleavage/methylation domain-containing protein n=1 Tax=Duganella violaceipulchra TaxID=2849652 RepID=A0AA41L316_9BURK|nr:type II secretion system protein [Duganella violaceicalia]MBV6323383.1 type II secretion system GspH family protein [Duganella violaceicalia]MCP2007663.1 prepilin-type N-terminal cleavage/methylation domain-containing protein [Duganella violaceicalia]